MKTLFKKSEENSTELVFEKKPNKAKYLVNRMFGSVAKHKAMTCVIIVAAVVVVGINVTSARKAKISNAVQKNKISTTVLQKQDLINSLSVTGTIASAESKSITTQLTGVEITSVNVAVGDYVNEGDVLITFDSSDIEENLADAKNSLNAASAKSDIEVNSAQRNLSDAQTTQAVQAERAQESVDKAYLDYAEIVDDRDAAYSEYESALAKVEKKKAAYKEAKENRTEIKEKYGKSSDEYKKADEKVNSAKTAYETAQAEAEASHSEFDKLAVEADAAYESYEKAVENQEDTNRSNEKSVAEKQDSVANAKLNQSTSTTSQKNQVEEYQQQLENCNVTAPFSGVITSVSVEVGDYYSGSEICVLQDSDNFIVEATVDEYDIASISKDMEAVVKTDATGDEEFAGIVTFVAPTPNASNAIGSASSAAAYSIEIDLKEANENLRIGMTAKTSILLDSRKDVFAVPYDCVQTNANGENVIYILDSSLDSPSENIKEVSRKEEMSTEKNSLSQKEIVVDIGLETDYYIEISSEELKEGMEVVLPNQVSSASKENENMMNPMGMSGNMPENRNGGGAPNGGRPGGF